MNRAYFCLALVALTPHLTLATQPDRLNYGSYKVGSQQAAVSFPPASVEPPTNRMVEFAGRRYPIGRDGSIGQGQYADGGWGEFARQYANLGSNPPAGSPWRVKVLVLARVDYWSFHPEGGYRFRRGSIESFQYPTIYESLARFAAMVRGTTGGQIEPQFDVEVDDDGERAEILPDTPQMLGSEFAKRLLNPRFNTKKFETDDGIDRGPWHGIFVIHSGLVDPLPLTEVRGTPVSLISYYTRSVLADGDRLALSLYASWIRQLSFRAAAVGYHVPVLDRPFDNPFATRPDRFMFSNMWGPVLDFNTVASAQYSQRKFRPRSLAPLVWSEVADDPWAKLPRVTTASVAGRFTDEAALTGLLEGAHDMTVFGDRIAAVPAERADLIGSMANARFDCRPLGYITGAQRNVVLFQMKSMPVGPAEINLLAGDPAELRRAGKMEDGAAIGPTSVGLARAGEQWFFVGDPAQLPAAPPSEGKAVETLPVTVRTEGTLRGARTTDPDIGDVIEISERGFYRSGLVEIHRAEPGTYLDLARQTILRFKFRQSGRDGYALRLTMANGRRGFVVLHREPFVPVQVIDQREPWVVSPLESVNRWQEFGVDVSSLVEKLGTGRLVDVAVTPVPYYEYFERQQVDAATAAITPIVFGSDAGLVIAPAAPPEQELEARLSRLAKLGAEATEEDLAFVRESLADPNRRVQATALRVLTKLKSPGDVPRMAELMRSTNPAVAVIGAEALAFQDTPEAWSLLRRGVEIGPFEHTRYAALLPLMRRKDAEFSGSISLLYASKSWRVRELAVRALGDLKTREASVVAMTFLREQDPAVRLAVVQTADVSQDIVARRLLYVAVNDGSEVIRVAAATRLIGQGAGAILNEALKSVRDESPYVRKEILEYLAANPVPDARPLILSALGDPDPLVKAAAVSALASLSASPAAEDWQAVFGESDPRVQASVVAAFAGRKWPLPPELRKTLLASADPSIVEQTEKLP